MDEWTIYTQVRSDGSMPFTVLAFHRTQFERRIREPWYQPKGIEIRNPRLPAPLDDGFDALRAFIAPAEEQAQFSAANTTSSAPYQQQEMQTVAKKQAERLSMPPPPRLAALVASTPPEPASESSQQVLLQQRSTSSKQAAIDVTQRLDHQLAAEISMDNNSGSPNVAPFSSAQYEQLSWSRPSLTPTSTNHNADCQVSCSTLVDSNSNPLSIPWSVLNVANYIKALPRNSLNMPMRTELTRTELAAHFSTSKGLLKQSSPLYRYVGDNRLFDAAWWNHLTRTVGRKEWNLATAQAHKGREIDKEPGARSEHP